jgi:pyrimidine deaminase RibD-like protein
VARVVAALEDPALYTRGDGATTARQLGVELEALKRSLDAELERWTRATEQVEMLSSR